ncbi:MAG: hypothetical protein OEW00_13540 [candidate division Zixibacteria bacterium]|nr:hypothetical protein [candidate division Zixibacteria bacterium]
MKKVLRKTLAAAKIAGVALTALALIISGAGSAQRLFSVYEQFLQSPAEAPVSARILPGPPAPDEVQDEMTPDGKPNTEQPAYLQAALPKCNNSEDRFRLVSRNAVITVASTIPPGTGSTILASTSLVSSGLCRQFTLLGTHPSGTS